MSSVRLLSTLERLESREVPAVTIQFDYSYDTGFFADPQRRAVMEAVGQQLGSFLTDSLPAVAFNPATPGNVWTITFPNPGRVGQSVSLANQTVPADTLRVYVGGADIGSAGLAGPGGLSASGSAEWVNFVLSRGTPGASGPVPTDFAPWGGTIRFNPALNWHFDLDTAGLTGGETDFYSVAAHELMHVLGFGADEWERFVTAAGYVGPNAVAVHGGPVPVDGADGHWTLDSAALGYRPLMNAYTLNGTRSVLSRLDLASLADIGWRVDLANVPATVPAPGQVPSVPPPPPPPTVNPGTAGVAGVGSVVPQVAVALGVGGGSMAVLREGDTVRLSVGAPGGGGGLRAAAGDVTGDGVTDLITGAGPGGVAQVRVIDGATGTAARDFLAFEAAFKGGVFLSVADVDRDGFADLAVSPDQSGGPRVRLLSGRDGSTLADFFGIDDPAFRGGARTALSDLNGDGVPDLMVAAGFGGGPRVAGFDGAALLQGRQVRLFGDFFAFEPALRNGVFLTGGDFNGDGRGDVGVGAGPGGGPRVLLLDGAALLGGQTVRLADFFAGDTSSRGGVRLTAKTLDGDALTDLVVANGQGSGATVSSYLGRDLVPGGTPAVSAAFDALGGFTGGVFVG